MDASFETTTFNANAGGWGGDDVGGPPPFAASSTANAFDRVPLPVTVENIVHGTIEDDKVQLGIYSFGTLRVCGRILSVEEKEKENHLVLCDPAATDPNSCDKLAVVVYQNAQGTVQLKGGDIVVAVGKLRTFGNSTSLVAFGIISQPDIALAEIFKLEALLANRYYSVDVPERLSTSGGMCPSEYEGTMLSNRPIDASNKQNAPTQFGGGFSAAQSTANNYHESKPSFPKTGNNRGLTGMREKIYLAIQSAAGIEQGMSLNDIKRNVGATSDADFTGDLQYLVSEGIIYNTMDDDHYATI